jgi:hypothetical protein
MNSQTRNFLKIITRTINDFKENKNKHLNEFQGNSSKELNEIKRTIKDMKEKYI